MKVLFVASGHKTKNIFEPGTVVYNQGESLKRNNIQIDYFLVNKKGLGGYASEILRLKRHLRKNHYDIIHAHYILSGWLSVMSIPNKPIVLSLMGTDSYGEYIDKNKIRFSSRYLILLSYLIQPFVKAIICKSKNIEKIIFTKNKSTIIPNGINFEKIDSIKLLHKKELGLEDNRVKNILFLGDISNNRKNYKLAENSVKLINNGCINLLTPYPVDFETVIKYLKAVDILIFPSFMEGSPNLVKEAMSCNCPVVATKVGDIEWLFGDEPGYFLTSFEPEDVAQKIFEAIEFVVKHGRTNGRERILKLGLDSDNIAKRIINLYESVI